MWFVARYTTSTCMDISDIGGSPRIDSTPATTRRSRWAKVRWPHFLPTHLGPQVTSVQCRLSAVTCESPGNFLAALFPGADRGSPIYPRDRVYFLSGCPHRPRHTSMVRATSRTGDVVVFAAAETDAWIADVTRLNARCVVVENGCRLTGLKWLEFYLF